MTTPLPEDVDVVVVGAGLAGLAAARTIQQRDRSCVVLEASDGVGGRVRTDLVDGFRLDRGFQVVLTAYPELHRLLDVPALDLRNFDPGAMVRIGQRFHRVGDPLRMPLRMLDSAIAPVGSPLDKARLARLLLRLRTADPLELLHAPEMQTIDALRAEGFSERMIDRFFRPLIGGIQLDPALSASRRMFETIMRCLAVGSSSVPALGMQEIPNQIAASLRPGTVHLRTAVASVAPGRVTTVDGAAVSARCVVVATEGPAAAQLLGMDSVGSRPVSCVWFAAPAAPLRDRLIILDSMASGPALNVAIMTNVSPAYGPGDGRALIAAACPATDRPDLEPDVRAQLRSWWGAGVDSWVHLRTNSIAHGQPDQLPPFRPKQRQSLGDGLFVCGDHRDTPSIQGALFSGSRCADAVLSSLAA